MPRSASGLLAVLAMLGLILGLAATLLVPPRPILLWNASDSMPLGLYRVRQADHVRAGSMVVAWAPPAARRIADRRGYLPERVPLLKRIAAARDDRICARRRAVLVNGRMLAIRLPRDGFGRPLPRWRGCRRLRDGEFLLLSDDARGFDGRYFGVTRRTELVGEARLLWAR